MSARSIGPSFQPLSHGLFSGQRGLQVWHLLEHLDACPTAANELTLVRGFQPSENLAERCLAGAVATDDSHSLSGSNH
jgi:hypothetical protein